MSIKYQLIIMFLIIAIIPMAFIGTLGFINARNSIETSHIEALKTIASLKVDMIEQYFQRIKGDIEIAQDYANVRANFPVLIQFANNRTHPDYLAAKMNLDGQLQTLQKVKGFFDIMLVNPEGKIVYVTNDEHAQMDLESNLPDPDGMAFKEGKKNIYFTSVFRDKRHNNEYAILVAAPINTVNGKFIGVITFELELNLVYELIQDTTGLGETGETLIGKKEGDGALFLNPLRYDKDAGLSRKVIFGDESAFPIQAAVNGKIGAGTSIDYRGTEIIAAWSYVPFMKWGLVAKIDTAEAFSSVRDLRKIMFIIGIVIFFVVALVALSFARLISRPIEALQIGVEIIGTGDLTYKMRSNAQDELGQLSRAFDDMTTNLNGLTTSLKRANQDLTHKNKELDEFSYIASHDLQEPVRKIVSFSELLRKDIGEDLPELAAKDLYYIIDGATRMQQLIQSLLDLSRVGRDAMKIEQVSLNACADQALKNLSATIVKSEARIVQDDLPVVWGDKTLLIQLYENLINNAIKYRSNEPPFIQLTFEVEKDDNVYGVQDNGIGIKPEYNSQIFMPFKRLHGRADYEGTGIGLSICRKAVQRHLGVIWVESELGKGSHFKFTLKSK